MLDFYKYINFIDGALASVSLSPQKREELQQLRDKVVDRYNDPNLYLSMLSDFSAGKSTLINKLIGKNLLRTAIVATTSVPTYIINHDSPDVTVSANTIDGESYDLSDTDERKSLEELLELRLPVDAPHLISSLTTDELLTDHGISSVNEFVGSATVKVHYDSDVSNLCIIDTPGVNPGSDYSALHAGRTKEILENKADSVIIMFPAHQNYSASFQTFLEEHALKFLKDAVFVVTMMDLIDEEEQYEVIKDVEVNLKQHFNLEEVKLLPCAARKVGRDSYWTEQFEKFKTELFCHLREKRELFINRTLSILLQKLLEEINSGIISENKTLEQKLNILAQNSVPNLNSVLDKDITDGRQRLKKQKKTEQKTIEKKTAELPEKIKASVNDSLRTLNKRSLIDNYANNGIEGDIKRECAEVENALKTCQNHFEKEFLSVSKTMTDTMMEYYGKIERLAQADADVKIKDTLSSVGSELGSKLSGIQVDSGGLGLASAAAGAGIAAAVFAALGPVGWIAGALVGLFGSDYMFIESARSKVRDGLFPRLPDIASGVKKEALKTLDAQEKGFCDKLEKYRGVLLDQYKEIYQRMTDALNNEMKQTGAFIERNNFMIAAIGSMKQELEQHINKAVIN